MKFFSILLGTIIFTACSLFVVEAPLSNFVKTYAYTDTSGSFYKKKVLKFLKDEMVSRVVLSATQKGKALEKTTAVSKLKVIDSNTTIVLPKVAEHKVWFNEKLYYSKIEADTKEKNYKVYLKSPEKKWNGVKEYKVPKSKKICWFSQVPECLKLLGLLDYNKQKKEFYIAWDSFPYHTEQLIGISDEELFSPATINFDSDYEQIKKFEIIINESSLFYFYNAKKEFKRYFWISQGISLIDKD